MNIKKVLLSCLAFSSISGAKGNVHERLVYSDAPAMHLFMSENQVFDGFILHCGTPAIEDISQVDEKVKEITNDAKFNQYTDFKKELNDIFAEASPAAKFTRYTTLIGLSPVEIPVFLKVADLSSYAQRLQENTGLPESLGVEVLETLRSAINDFMAKGSVQTQKA